jgi:hypothetical protein
LLITAMHIVSVVLQSVWFVVVAAYFDTLLVNATVAETACKRFTITPFINQWNTSSAKNLRRYHPLYLGATELAGSSVVLSGQAVNFVVFRPKKEFSMSDYEEVCRPDIVHQAERYLGNIKRYTTDSNAWISGQSSLLGRIRIEGHLVTPLYWRRIWSPALFLKEIKSLDDNSSDPVLGQVDFYWFRWTPLIQGHYNLSLIIDFINCENALGGLSQPMHTSGKDGLRGNCRIIYSNVMIISVIVGSNKKLNMPNVMSAKCDLSDMSNGAWLASPVLNKCTYNTTSGMNFTGWQPVWIPATCPSFRRRLESSKSKNSVFMVGDSNSRRACTAMKRKCDIMLPTAYDATVAYLDDRKEDCNVESFNSNFRKCVTGSSFCAVNIGHHMVGYNSTQLASVITRSVQWLQKYMKQGSGQLTLWSNLASVSSQLHPVNFKETLHYLSNVYREQLQNIVVKDLIMTACGESSGRCRFVDMFSPSSALMDICHEPGDPVHFRRGWCSSALYALISDSFLVQESCTALMDCHLSVVVSLTPKRVKRLANQIDKDVGYLPKPHCVYNCSGICRQLGRI